MKFCRSQYRDVVRKRIVRVNDDDPEYREEVTVYACSREDGHAGDHTGTGVPPGASAVDIDFLPKAIWR